MWCMGGGGVAQEISKPLVSTHVLADQNRSFHVEWFVADIMCHCEVLPCLFAVIAVAHGLIRALRQLFRYYEGGRVLPPAVIDKQTGCVSAWVHVCARVLLTGAWCVCTYTYVIASWAGYWFCYRFFGHCCAVGGHMSGDITAPQPLMLNYIHISEPRVWMLLNNVIGCCSIFSVKPSRLFGTSQWHWQLCSFNPHTYRVFSRNSQAKKTGAGAYTEKPFVCIMYIHIHVNHRIIAKWGVGGDYGKYVCHTDGFFHMIKV